jgi:hypothetical protein
VNFVGSEMLIASSNDVEEVDAYEDEDAKLPLPVFEGNDSPLVLASSASSSFRDDRRLSEVSCVVPAA